MQKLVLLLVAASAWGQTTINGDRTIAGKLDLSNSTAFVPPGVAVDPSGSCTNPAPGKPNLVVSLASGNLFSCWNGTWHESSGGSNGQSPTLRGTWTSGTSYNVLDVVVYQGGSWWAVGASTNVVPGTDLSSWVQIAAPGATGPAGPAGQALNPRGAWLATTSYNALDTVSYSGSGYVASVSNTNVIPTTNASVWNLMGTVTPQNFQNSGTMLPSQNTVNFAGPLTASNNAANSRIDVGCGSCEVTSNKGALGGYAPLDSSARVPAANLPTIPIAQGGTGSTSNTGWQTNLKYQSAGTGSVARTMVSKLGDFTNAADFGAVCNGSTDDTAALNAAITYVANSTNGGIVRLPPGTCLVSSTITLPNAVSLIGQDILTTGIRASSNFPTGIAVINMGPTNTNGFATHYSVLENLEIDCNNVASIGVYSNTMQEGSYIDNILVYNFMLYGIDLEGYGVQNTYVRNIYMVPGPSATTAIGIHLNSVQNRTVIEKTTIAANNAAPLRSSPAIYLENYSTAAIRDIHCEDYTTCIKIDSGSVADVSNVMGAANQPELVQFTATSYGGTATNITATLPITNVGINDLLHSNKLTQAQEVSTQFYASGSSTTGGTGVHSLGNVLTTSPYLTNSFALLSAGNFTIGNMKMLPDTTGGSLFQTSTTGALLQNSSLATSGYPGGGLHLVGNGSANDPSAGAISAGVTHDMSIFTARASSANIIGMSGGSINFFADAGLSSGSTYTPHSQMNVGPSGVQIVGKASDPGCTASSHVGRLWNNTSGTPSVLQTCVATATGFSWSAPVASVFGRTGSAIVAQSGDYAASQVTNAVDQTQTYSNPSWIGSLAWSKVSGAPNVYSAVQGGGAAVTARSNLNFAAPLSVSDNAGQSRTDVSLPQATGSQNGYLANTDWTAFNAKASQGSCPSNQFISAANSTGGPTCAQVNFAGVAGTATKSQQTQTTVYSDQGNAFSAGTQDFSAADHTKPIKSGPLSAIPATCSAGEYYFATDQQREALKQCGPAGTFQGSSGVVTSGLIADYWMSNCDGSIGSGAALPDCSGSGNSATVPTGGNPAWTQQGLTWTMSANNPVMIPNAVLNGFKSVQIYADMSLPNNYNNTAQIQAFLTAGSSIVLWGNVLAVSPLCCGLYGDWNGNPATQEIDPAVGPNLFTYILDNSNDTICIGANCSVSYYSRGGNNPTSRSGPFLLGGNNQTGQMSGTIYRVLFYNRALTASEVAQNDASIDSWIKYRGVTRGKYAPPASTNNLVCVGDSITQGYGATPACSNGSLSGLSDTFQIYNMGMTTEYLSNMLTAAQKFATGINPSGKSNITWIFAGTNDLCGPTNTLTPAQTLQKLVAFSRYMRSQGAKVMVLPMISRIGSAQGTTCDVLHDQYNTLIAQNWPSFADSFVYGMLQDANLTGDGAYANTTYFQGDGIHPTTAGQSLIAGYVQAEINNLLTGTTNGAGYREAIVTKTSSYTAGMGDSVILCNASTAPVTITLPSAAGIQGRSFQMKKTDASSNACTLATSASQKIDGASTVAISTRYSSTKVESDNANWQVIQ